MWELDHKVSRVSKNWCFRTVVLEKMLESPLECKEIKPVHPKGNQPEYSLQGLMMKLKLQYFGHLMWRAAVAKSLQSCPTLCDPIDGSPPGSPVPGILQARTLEWVAISFSNAWKWKVKVKSLSRVWLLATPWTAAYQAPLSVEFARQEYWSGLPLPSPISELKHHQMILEYLVIEERKEVLK